MTNKRSTKRALLLSALSLLLCVSMLVGSTFAWFTDSVTSGKNTIQSGNLDVELYYTYDAAVAADVNNAAWVKVNNNTDVFGHNLWEPGYTKVAYFKVVNEGSLELKYQLAADVYEEKPGVNQAGAEFLLSDYIKTALVNVGATRNEILAMTTGTPLKNSYDMSKGSLKAGAATVVGLAIWMPTTVDNVANHDGKTIPEITFGINLLATQKDAETDSFGKDYDEDSAVDTIAEAEALMAAGKNVTLIGCNEPDGILVIPEAYTGTLTLGNSTLKSVQGLKDANIVIYGNVVVNAKYDGPATLAATAKPFDGSAITANGALKISGTGRLTAIAADVKGAVGIGGKVSTTIENITIGKVTGSFVQQNFIKDTSYGKSEPEGGAAIGGAEIKLKGVTIVEALGGSKAAGIGARFWNAVVIDIENCIINKVVGGNASAGIGGSRVSSDATVDQDIAIKIKDSQITAFGGQFGAGIGAGYDTHCAEDLTTLPDCNIEITGNSVINATGGKYGAGIGTGYHTAGLSGFIADTVEVNAVGGGNREKYTAAMAVGFGVIDMDNPNREGAKASKSKFDYKGTIITVQNAPVVVNSSEKLKAAIAAGEDNIVLYDGNYKITDIGFNGKTVTISGTKDAVIDANTNVNNQFVTGANLVFDGVTINLGTDNYLGLANTASLTYKNCTINGYQYLYGSNINFENCVINSTGYAVCVYDAKNVTFSKCEFNTAGKALLLYKDDLVSYVSNVKVEGCVFNASASGYASAIKNQACAAIEIHNYGASYNLTASGNTIDSDFSGEWRIKNFEATKGTTVTVNGTAYTQTALDGKLMTVTNNEATLA